VVLTAKFSSAGIIFIHGLFGSKWIFSQAIFCSGHFLILQNSWTFPGPGKLIFPGFPGCVGTCL